MKLWIYIAIGCVLTLGGIADAAADRSDVYARMDEIALQAPPEVATSVAALTDYLTAEAKTDLQKARVIYRWITGNIDYDTQAYFSGHVRNPGVKAESVLQARSAVCDGYARLFEAMAKHAGLGVERISGTAKGYNFATGAKLQRANHVWNGIELEGAWYLVDATWGAGYVDNESRQFVRAYSDFFFLTAPEQLKYSHHPKDKIWQLLDKPVSFNTFAAYVDVRPAFFQNGMELVDAIHHTLRTSGDLDLHFKAPAETEVTAILVQGNTAMASRYQLWQRTGDTVTGSLALPAAGHYELQVFARRKSDTGKFPVALIYDIDSRGAAKRSFPVLYEPFFKHGLDLVSHKDGVIKTKSQVDVILANPGHAFMTGRLLQGKDILPLNLIAVQRTADSIVAKVLLPGKGEYQLQLFVATTAEEAAQLAVEYTINASEGAGADTRYPQLFSAYMAHSAELRRPFSATLKSYQEQTFEISVPDASRVAVVINNDWHYLEKRDGVFIGAVAVTSGVVKLVGSFGGAAGQFQVLAQFDAI